MAETIRRMSRPQRAVFYASPEGEPFAPLFDDDYDDTICLKVYDNQTLPSQSGPTQLPQDPASLQHSRAWHYDQRHLDAMVQYVEDNPRRAIIRKLYPQFMTRCMHVWIAGRDYGAFGNLALLKWPDKRAVIAHRKAQPGQRSETGVLYPYGTPYEKTVQFELEKQTLLNDARSGQCVLVSAGISEGEKQIRNAALMEHLPFIHLQKESFGMLWKPEKSRFEACAQGTLLILAPWHVDGVLDYDQFHNLNQLAQQGNRI